MIINPEDTGVANPFILAEILLGKKILWKRIKDRKSLLESIFKMSFQDIIHPRSGSPVFFAFKKAWQITVKSDYTYSEQRMLEANDLAASKKFSSIKNLGQMKEILGIKSIDEIPVSHAEEAGEHALRIEIPIPRIRESIKPIRRIPLEILPLISREGSPEKAIEGTDGWEPTNGHWGDSGSFFHEAAEYSDPIQGVAADCYLIAAQASVAWARPRDISHQTRATGTKQQAYVNIFSFHGDDGKVTHVEVTGMLPVSDISGSYIYSRSSENGEFWPGILEKAYAKWRTSHTGDKPDMSALGGGSPFCAITHLTGLQQWHYPTKDHSTDELWDMVRENSLSKRTFNPMAACTWSEKLLQEAGSTYIGTGIVPGHAYSILGWDYREGLKYLVLRNPWGWQEPEVGVLTGGISMYDISWWRNIEFADPDGVFGIEVEAFKNYFSYIGGGKQ
jgi:hypothetical protein